MGSFKWVGNRSMPETKSERGSSNGNKYCVGYQNLSLGRCLMSYIRRQERGTTLATGKHRRVRFRSCGTVGYGPTMWVKAGRVLTFARS